MVTHSCWSLPISICLTYGKRRTFVRTRSSWVIREKKRASTTSAIAHDHVKTCSRRTPLVCWIILDVILCVSGAYVVRHVYPLLTRNAEFRRKLATRRRTESTRRGNRRNRSNQRSSRLRTIERSFPSFFPSSSVGNLNRRVVAYTRLASAK